MRYIARLASTLNYASHNLDERIRYIPAIVFEDKYAEWYDYIARDRELMEVFGFEFFADEESYRAFVDAHAADYWLEEYRLDDLEIETIGREMDHKPVFAALMNEAYQLVSLPDAPDRDDDEAIRAFMEANEDKYKPYLPPRRQCSFIEDMALYGVARDCVMGQRMFALLIRAGLSVEEVLRVCSLLHTYSAVDKHAEYDLILDVDWATKHAIDIERYALFDVYKYRLAYLTERIERRNRKEDIIATIEQEGEGNHILKTLFALHLPVCRIWEDEKGRGVNRRDLLMSTEEVLIKQGRLDDFLALSDDDLGFCAEACGCGVPLSDVLPELDCLESYRDAYEAGVPMEDLFA